MNGSSADGEKIQKLLDALRRNEPGAMSELVSLVYPELRKQARRILNGEYGNRTFQTTDLIHEAYIDLMKGSRNWENQTHFLCVAAMVMRHIVIQHARRKMSLKRGGGQKIISADDEENILEFEKQEDYIPDFEKEEDLIRLDDALIKLAAVDSTKAEIVEKRFFLGMTVENTAKAMNISPQTVKRKWKLAKAWLYREMTR